MTLHAIGLTGVKGKITTVTLASLKAAGQPAVFLAAYDYPTAVFADRAGVDMLLVGDSVAMTVLGHRHTVEISMDEMLVFTRAVCRGARRPFLVGPPISQLSGLRCRRDPECGRVHRGWMRRSQV